MLKRPLSEEVERAEGLSNGNKIARVGPTSEPQFGEPASHHADDEVRLWPSVLTVSADGGNVLQPAVHPLPVYNNLASPT